MGLNLPAAELIISASVLLFGILLALKNRPNTAIVVGISAIAGIFHGYAYGEAIVGAEMGPLMAYLLGFTSIQAAIALAAYWIGRRFLSASTGQLRPTLRSAGFVLCGIGGTFLSTLVVESLFP